ncbi:hypothetical protein CKO28_02625 [Rhodovibrio sodomensis]|uniref:Conjugal transfer protein TrbG n=1 Tax=Rhodovibrio sodomensis TaxID=1088 RepID=A0ABS1DAK1_9PROT|nr:TrbG/VirB9 family P-type conjugative transfer protein [Rhodovibrio sodomensis]MBK1666937.1 hypothetical protein [Rhodovibrio sodomensis]
MLKSLAGGAVLALLASTALAQTVAPPNAGPGGNAYQSQPYYDPIYQTGSQQTSGQGRQGMAPQQQPYVSPQQVERARRQSEGDYKPIDRSLTVPLGLTQDAWANPIDNMSNGQVAPGVVRFRWSPELVMPVRLRESMVTMVTLPEWETVADVILGENYYFEAMIVRENTIALRAAASGVDTSATIIGGSGNAYNLYLRAESTATKQLTDVSVFIDAAPASPRHGWFRSQGGLNGALPRAMDGGQNTPTDGAPRLPGPPKGSAEGQGEIAAPDTSPAPEGTKPASPLGADIAGSKFYIPKHEMRFVHKMFEVSDGDRAIAPELVYTNGRFTFLHYGDKAATIDLPVVYRVVDGVETLVNTRIIGDQNEVLVVEALGDFVLRSGRRIVCVLRVQDRDRQKPPQMQDEQSVRDAVEQAEGN